MGLLKPQPQLSSSTFTSTHGQSHWVLLPHPPPSHLTPVLVQRCRGSGLVLQVSESEIREVRPPAKQMPELGLEPSLSKQTTVLSHCPVSPSIPVGVERGQCTHMGLGSLVILRQRDGIPGSENPKAHPTGGETEAQGREGACQDYTAELALEASSLNPSARDSFI